MEMSIVSGILTALFIMAVVFLVLVMLWAIIRIVGSIIKAVERSRSTPGINTGQQG